MENEQQNRWKMEIRSPDGVGFVVGFDNAALAALGFSMVAQALAACSEDKAAWAEFCAKCEEAMRDDMDKQE